MKANFHYHCHSWYLVDRQTDRQTARQTDRQTDRVCYGRDEVPIC